MSAAVDLSAAAGPPPAGQVSDFSRSENQNGLAIFVLVFCLAIATICLVLRGYARIFLLKKIGVEDYLILCAYGCFIGTLWASFAMIETSGFLVHTWNITIGDLIPTTYWILLFGVFYSIVLPLLKSTILLEWSKMFVPRGNRTSSWFWWGCVILITLQVVVGIGIVIALNIQCLPHKKIWDIRIEGKCFPLIDIQLTSASFQLFSDIAIFLLPQHVIWTLKMSWQKRLGVSLIFGLGLLACVSAVFRLTTTITFGQKGDLYDLGPLIFWATAEMACGFFIVCVPTIPKILKETGTLKKIKKVFGMGSGNKSTKNMDRYGGSTHGKTVTANQTNNYYKLDEDGVPMGDLKGSRTESTERLHDGKLGTNIVRTTHITVTQDDRSSDPEAAYPPQNTWGR